MILSFWISIYYHIIFRARKKFAIGSITNQNGVGDDYSYKEEESKPDQLMNFEEHHIL